MSLTSEMRTLKQEIVRGYKDRDRALEKITSRAHAIQEEAHGWLNDVNEKRLSMSKHLWGTLAHVRPHLSKTEATRSGRVQSLMEKIAKKNREDLNGATLERSKEVKGMMKDFHRSRNERGRKLKHDLKEAVAHLKKECAHKQEEMRKDIQGACSIWAELSHSGEKGEKKNSFGRTRMK